MTTPILGLILIFTANLLSACGEQVAHQREAYFIPPTLAATANQIPLVTPTPIPPTSTPECTNSLSYVSDINIPDGSAFPPNSRIEKGWLVRNDGTCNWDGRYELRYDSGDPLGAETVQALFPARSGTEVEIYITFTTPEQPGRYQSFWQAYNARGEAFGDRIFIDIIVDDRLEPTAAPTPTVDITQ